MFRSLGRNKLKIIRVYFLTFICLYLHFILSKRKRREEESNSQNVPTCIKANYLNCGGSNEKKKNIGLLLTKDDGKIVSTWFGDNSRYFSALVVLDGSIESRGAELFFAPCKLVYYYHESNFTSLKKYSDGELRELGHKLVTNLFGHNIWITMAHTDEFFYHSPLKVIIRAEKEGADFVKWQALHVLPHPSEYGNYLKNTDAPVTELFRHYYHFGPRKGAFLESRMFLNKPELRWDNKQGSLLPINLKRQLSIYPTYIHYKLLNLSLDTYTQEGVHKRHWNKVSSDVYKSANSKHGVGIRWRVDSIRDFFVDHFPNSKKYDHVSCFKNNRIESYLDVGDEYKDSKKCFLA